jgi:Sap, sulfolipid-1-addressing protein
VGKVFFFAFTAALNPTLLAATTVMLLLPNPKRLLFGYLLGAMMISITLGLVIVFELQGTSFVEGAQNQFSPALDYAFGGIALAVAYLLATRRDEAIAERRRRRKAAKDPDGKKGPPRWQQFLGRGSARDAFVVGALLTLPGGSYIAGMGSLAGQDLGDAATVLVVIVFNLIMLALLEIPALGYVLAPETTPARVDRFKAALVAHGRHAGIWIAGVVGALLVLRGTIELLAA